jgi:hypothetical protein
MKVNRKAFFDQYRLTYGKLSQSQVDGLDFLLGQFERDPEFADVRWIAYALATIKHECADAWQPIVEYGAGAYFAKYEPGTAIGKRLGNVFLGDGARYRGRGYVQLTGRRNYGEMTNALSLSGDDDLVNHPERATDPEIAYRILIYGMRHGSFTGKKLSDYIGKACNYKHARRIINGNDKADLIAGYARVSEGILRAALA